MPLSTQVSSVKAILVGDIDRNGKKDLVLHGNDHTWRAQLGKIDALYGIICTQDDRGMFHALPVSQTGLITEGDVRAMITVQSNKGTTIICTRNNGKMAAVKMKS
jgi:hypothetical protein